MAETADTIADALELYAKELRDLPADRSVFDVLEDLASDVDDWLELFAPEPVPEPDDD